MNWLVSSRLYNLSYEWQKQKVWGNKMANHAMRVRDHVGMRVGILGYGSIGRHSQFFPISTTLLNKPN